MGDVTFYDIGDRRKLGVEISDETGETPLDPTDLKFYIQNPVGETTIYTYGTDAELEREAEGNYFVLFDCAIPGLHTWRFEASGNVGEAEEKTFIVKRSVFK